MPNPPLLKIEHATVVRDGRRILDDLNLEIEEGRHTAIIGPNGSGKSSLIRLITRRFYPLARENPLVSIFGRERWDGHEHLVDSTDFMNLEALPKRILFVGGGFVSFEFAHIAARAGSTPVIIDRGRRPLKGFDPDLVELLIARGTPAGIGVRRSTTITGIEKTATGYRVSVDQSGAPEN